ncbi:solute carrier family 49 member 4 isoform X2 [Nematostella vectensis]|uniref:solute carrier family 49 member 4 isoform X2 n=1 Tax=Nematostella vectensis TaxID=45351 RepID=UPI0020770EE1|nr:solute carrier family 49 member 4 isoform X2 [Nematostella vectensis]
MPRKQRRRSDKSPLIINQNDTLSSGNDAPVSISSSTGLFKIYKRRWYILGLRCAVVLCAFLMTIGKAMQVIPASGATRLILMNTGQFILMLGSPVSLGAPPSISATWFPPSERNTATAIATLAAYLGIALSFAIAPVMAPMVGPSGNSTMSRANGTTFMNVTYTDNDKEEMRSGIRNFMLLELVVSGILFLMILVYFPSRPPIPPSLRSVKETPKYKDGLGRLLRNGSYWLLAVVFAISFGVYFGWLAVFALAVKPFGIGETKAGWLGCAGTMAGITSGIILARCADYVQHYTKNILMVLFLGTSLAQLFFSMTCSELIPYSEIVLFASIIVGGLFFNGTTPLMFELAMECVYPVAEGITAVLLLVAGNVIYLAFQVAFMFPGVSVKWMNWFTVVATGICVPALLFYKGKMSYFKLGLDEDKREETAKRLNTV